MAKKTKYHGSSYSKKTSFNSNLYERNKYDPEKDHSHTDKIAYIIYKVCAVLFAILMILNYMNANVTKATIYLVFLCVDVYLIFIYHKKTGK